MEQVMLSQGARFCTLQVAAKRGVEYVGYLNPYANILILELSIVIHLCNSLLRKKPNLLPPEPSEPSIADSKVFAGKVILAGHTSRRPHPTPATTHTAHTDVIESSFKLII
jgi:hypothetical protein